MLLEKIRNDHHPSATQMTIVEESIPRAMIPDYLEVLIEKASQDNVPSDAQDDRSNHWFPFRRVTDSHLPM